MLDASIILALFLSVADEMARQYPLPSADPIVVVPSLFHVRNQI